MSKNIHETSIIPKNSKMIMDDEKGTHETNLM